MNKLVNQIEVIKKENPDMRAYLGASKGKEDFYGNKRIKTLISSILGYRNMYARTKR